MSMHSKRRDSRVSIVDTSRFDQPDGRCVVDMLGRQRECVQLNCCQIRLVLPEIIMQLLHTRLVHQLSTFQGSAEVFSLSILYEAPECRARVCQALELRHDIIGLTCRSASDPTGSGVRNSTAASSAEV